jgi:hypothetical protein
VLKGIKNGRLGPSITHLLFTDDSIFFAWSDKESVDALHRTLNTFCDGSGQRINLEKSTIFFGNGCQEILKEEVKQKLGVFNETLQDPYLGMPTQIGRSPIITFRYLFYHMWRRVSGLPDRPLSKMGNEIMLKAFIQAIPTYVMSCFLLPIATCEEMRKIIVGFWWDFKDGKRKMHWRSWEWLSSPKNIRGMGFQDMELFNQAMLGRQCWRLLTEPNSLCARVLKGRYFPDGDFWNAPCPRSASYTWRSILHGRKLVMRGIMWGIGDGSTTWIKHDRWILGTPPCLVNSLVPISGGQTVASLIESRSWNEDYVQTIFWRFWQIRFCRFQSVSLARTISLLGLTTRLVFTRFGRCTSWLVGMLPLSHGAVEAVACPLARPWNRRTGRRFGLFVHLGR